MTDNASAAGSSRAPYKQVQFLESKLNKLRWINDDLNKQVFDAIQRGHRLAGKLGYQNLDEAEAALATQAPEEGQSQLQQLSQYPTDELASHVQDLQSELISHVQLSKTTLAALGDALKEMSELREENLALRREIERLNTEKTDAGPSNSSSDPSEVEYLRKELAVLQQQYADLREAKERSDEKHAEDFGRWRRFRDWLIAQEEKRDRHREERAAKRRKLSPKEDAEEDKENDGSLSPDRLPEADLDRRFGKIRRRLQELGPMLGPETPMRSRSPAPKARQKKSAVLGSRNLNSTSALPPPPSGSMSKPSGIPSRPQNRLKRRSSISVDIPDEDVPASSETEPDSQPISFLLPSHLHVTALPSTVPQKRPRSPISPDQESSETEVESQLPSFLYPSQIIPEPPVRSTPRPQPATRIGGQLMTPITVARPLRTAKGKEVTRLPPQTTPAPKTSSASDPFRVAVSRDEVQDVKPLLPDTPASLAPRKGKGRMVPESKEKAESDENAAPSASAAKGPVEDYAIFKGRGRYGKKQQSADKTINALYALDPAHNNGVEYQYEEVVRDKQRRKHMHAVDCECCRDYYEALGPLPKRPQAPLWRSPDSTPSKPPRGDSFGNDDGAAAAIEEHKQAISRHRQHWPRAKTPPGYWNIGFPDTQEVEAMNAEAARMHAEKRAMVAQEAERGGRYKKR
ncbi:DNA repair protein endonuclease SAE2/CtIP C-terminus-domain-containing protein [Trametes polyzona]|nr:DNA repair protein endonuclease SAE2/CtIP C-terminus-domain-containing protein [Trametes polyzona]